MVEPSVLEARKADLDGYQRGLYHAHDSGLRSHLLVVLCKDLGRDLWSQLVRY